MNQVFQNMQNMQNQRPCIDITKDVIVGLSPWEKYLKEKEEAKNKEPKLLEEKKD